MIDADIYSGDIVIVDKSNRNPDENQVAVCELNGEYTLKRFVKKNGEGWLVPANPDYPRIKVTEDDDFSIWDTVTYIIQKPRGGVKLYVRPCRLQQLLLLGGKGIPSGSEWQACRCPVKQ